MSGCGDWMTFVKWTLTCSPVAYLWARDGEQLRRRYSPDIVGLERQLTATVFDSKKQVSPLTVIKLGSS